MNIKKPNLFKFATSELSQDAFFCWLLSWLEEESENNEELKKVAFQFLQVLTENKLKLETGRTDGQIKVYRQKKNIDIIIELLSYNRVIIIEDKLNGYDSQIKQLNYRDVILKDDKENLTKRYTNDQILSIYIKTGIIDSRDNKLERKPIEATLIDLDIIHNILNEHHSDNSIFSDFKDYIKEKIHLRKEISKKLFQDDLFDDLGTHLGQSLFFKKFIDHNVSPILGDHCFIKHGTSTGGQKWTECWITKHGSNNSWPTTDSIFYRLELRKYGEKSIPYLSMRQYYPELEKNDPEDLKQKKKRYLKLKENFNQQADKLDFQNKLKKPRYTSYKYYGSDFGAFNFKNGEVDLLVFLNKLADLHKRLLPNILQIIE